MIDAVRHTGLFKSNENRAKTIIYNWCIIIINIKNNKYIIFIS